MKVNVRFTASKNYQQITLDLLEIEVGDGLMEDYADLTEWGAREARRLINELEPGECVTQGDRNKKINNEEVVKTKNYKPASEKQLQYMLKLGYDGPITGISSAQATVIIDDLKKIKNNFN